MHLLFGRHRLLQQRTVNIMPNSHRPTRLDSRQLSLLPSEVAKSSTSFGWGNGGNVTSAGWQVTLCDPIMACEFG